MVHEKIHSVLKDLLKEENYTDFDIEVEEVSTEGANYTSNLFKVDVLDRKGNLPTLHLFVKVACPSVKLRSTLDEWKIYTTEHFFYSNLKKKFEEIEKENNVPEAHRLVCCKYYGCSLVPLEEIIVLEDLTASNWLAYDRTKPMDWPYAKSAVTELAKFHALSFAYSEKNSSEFNKVLEDLKTQMNPEALSAFVENSKDIALKKVKPENKELLDKYLKEFEVKIKKVNEAIGRNVITHGVYRPSNLMHKVREEKLKRELHNADLKTLLTTKRETAVDIMIVDLQTLQGASPVVDLLYFIFTASDEDFRREYYDKLIDHYYTELTAAMKRLNLDPEKIYSRAVYDKELKEKLPFGLTISVFALPVVTVNAEDAPKVDKDMELSAFCAEKASDIYVKRLNGVVNDFMKWGLLK